jgi:hypothetical protein
MLTVTCAESHIKAPYAACRYAECHYAECRYDECHYAECRYADCHGAVFSFVSRIETIRFTTKF